MTGARRGGQTPVVLVMIVAGLLALLLLCFDVFLSARAKRRLVNAGDAAALAAAAWQGRTLNLIGELNLAHLAAACDSSLAPVDMTNAINGANALAERLAFVGPAMGFYAANLAARRNFTENHSGGECPHDAGMARLVEREIRWALENADAIGTATWPDKGRDYAAMLQAVLDAGIVAGADNARQLSAASGGFHLYYQYGFYSAVAARDQVWFCRWYGYDHDRAISELNGFTRPSEEELAGGAVTPDNPGFFGVGVAARRHALADLSRSAENAVLYAWDAYRGGSPVSGGSLADRGVLGDRTFPWFFYSPDGDWREWRELHLRNGSLPLLGEVRPEYDVYGAMAACRVAQEVATATATSVTNTFVWRSAAKPFGCLPDGRRVADLFGTWDGGGVADMPLVLPSFSFTRLVALGGVGSGRLHRADESWVAHLGHLRSASRISGCGFCARIAAWEGGLNRELAEKLAKNPHDEVCAPPGRGRAYDNEDEFNN